MISPEQISTPEDDAWYIKQWESKGYEVFGGVRWWFNSEHPLVRMTNLCLKKDGKVYFFHDEAFLLPKKEAA